MGNASNKPINENQSVDVVGGGSGAGVSGGATKADQAAAAREAALKRAAAVPLPFRGGKLKKWEEENAKKVKEILDISDDLFMGKRPTYDDYRTRREVKEDRARQLRQELQRARQRQAAVEQAAVEQELQRARQRQAAVEQATGAGAGAGAGPGAGGKGKGKGGKGKGTRKKRSKATAKKKKAELEAKAVVAAAAIEQAGAADWRGVHWRLDKKVQGEPVVMRVVRTRMEREAAVEQAAGAGAGTSRRSRYVGVSWDKRYRKWVAKIQIDGNSKRLGYFDDEEEAAQAYDDAARKRDGPTAAVNFPAPGSGETKAAKPRSSAEVQRAQREAGPTPKSKYMGVNWVKKEAKWRSQIKVDGTSHHLGYFTSEDEAAQAYDDAARKRDGATATVNFPTTGSGERQAVKRAANRSVAAAVGAAKGSKYEKRN